MSLKRKPGSSCGPTKRSLIKSNQDDVGGEFDVETILDFKLVDSELEFLVKWEHVSNFRQQQQEEKLIQFRF